MQHPPPVPPLKVELGWSANPSSLSRSSQVQFEALQGFLVVWWWAGNVESQVMLLEYWWGHCPPQSLCWVRTSLVQILQTPWLDRLGMQGGCSLFRVSVSSNHKGQSKHTSPGRESQLACQVPSSCRLRCTAITLSTLGDLCIPHRWTAMGVVRMEESV